MNRATMAVAAMCLSAVFAVAIAGNAYANETSARDIQAAVDQYLSSTDQDTNLVGGPGTAGYDNGFWIRGGDFSLKMNLTLQARFEAMDWDDAFENATTGPAGGPLAPITHDTSGFSLPRATLKFSGEAPCNMRYYMELEFGHTGLRFNRGRFPNNNFGPHPQFQSYNFDNTREAWIEWGCSETLNIRMGQIAIPTTRQLMVAPELQQFVDISLASAFLGWHLPGMTDRPRDHGVMLHGAFGCDNEWSYMFAITNGDGGDSLRNVINQDTSDNLAFSARVNWAFLKPIGYQEGALNADTCGWYGELGAWGFYYADRTDNPHTTHADSLRWGLDLALGYGGWSFTGAFSMVNDSDIPAGAGLTNDVDATAYLAQLGYHFPGTAWEVAVRYSAYNVDNDALASDGTVSEIALGVNYYLAGHGNKLSLDVAMLSGDDANAALIFDPYTGYGGIAAGDEDYGLLLRFQWQLAL